MGDLFVNGVVMGCIYALLAMAINIIYSTSGIINFAHAELVMLGGMFGVTLIYNGGLSLLPALIVVCIIISLTAILLYYTTIKPFGNNLMSSMGWLMTTLGAGIIFRNIAQIIWGTQPRPFPYIGGDHLISIFGINIMPHYIWVIIITFVIAVFFNVILGKTMLGNALKATAFSHNITKLMGISAETTVLICFALSGIVAALSLIHI